eukprot:1198763-Pleurochrysis_carterae.AAC.1
MFSAQKRTLPVKTNGKTTFNHRRSAMKSSSAIPHKWLRRARCVCCCLTGDDTSQVARLVHKFRVAAAPETRDAPRRNRGSVLHKGANEAPAVLLMLATNL